MNRIFSFLLLISFALWTVSCRNSASSHTTENHLVSVNVYTVEKKVASFIETFPATVVALKQVDLRSQVTGYVTGIYFKEGEPVAKGQKLYEIDRTVYLANYNQAKSNVDIAQANLDKAQRDADRFTALHQQQAVAEQAYDDAMTNLKNAQLQVISARATLQRATSDLDYSVILAPFDGTVGISQVRIGTLVTPGQTLLNTISSDDPIGVDFEVNAKEVIGFQHIEKEKPASNDSTFRISMPDNSVYAYSGRISIIDRAFDPETGTITVRLTYPNKERILKPGMSCNVMVANQSARPQAVIPYLAVTEQMGEYFIFLVRGNLAHQVKVTMGEKIGGDVIITSGLSSGDIIVTDGIQKLREGSLVQTIPAGQAQQETTRK